MLQNINLTPPEDIQQLANNLAIAVNLRDTFLYPYKIEDATTFLDLATNGSLGNVFGIYENNTFVGYCSLIPIPQYDVYRISAEIGYGLENLIGAKDMPPKR